MLPHTKLHGQGWPHLHAYCVAPLTVIVDTSVHGGLLEKSPLGAFAHAGSTAASAFCPASRVLVLPPHSGTTRQFSNLQPFAQPGTLATNDEDSQPAAAAAFLQSASV